MVLVTGATGHLGNVLIRRLLEQNPSEPVRILVLPDEDLTLFDDMPLEICRGDVRDAEAVQRAVAGARLVFHLAGIVDPSERNPEWMRQVNVEGTRHVVDACLAAAGSRLIYVSSVHALPDQPDGHKIDEQDELRSGRLQGHYARSKAAATHLVRKAITEGLDAVILFPSGIIGPSDFKLSEIGQLFRMVSGWQRWKHLICLNGAYDFVDVRDVVDGMIRAAQRGQSGESYILSGQRISVPEIICQVREALGQTQTIIHKVPTWMASLAAWLVDRWGRLFHRKSVLTPYSIKVLHSNSFFSHAKASRELGYQPRPVSDSIRDSVAWLMQAGLLRRKREQKM
jgi:dihydroflavonol-4-reductase